MIINNNLSKKEQSKLRINAIIVSSCYENEQKRIALMKFHDEMLTFLFELTFNSLKD